MKREYMKEFKVLHMIGRACYADNYVLAWNKADAIAKAGEQKMFDMDRGGYIAARSLGRAVNPHTGKPIFREVRK